MAPVETLTTPNTPPSPDLNVVWSRVKPAFLSQLSGTLADSLPSLAFEREANGVVTLCVASLTLKNLLCDKLPLLVRAWQDEAPHVRNVQIVARNTVRALTARPAVKKPPNVRAPLPLMLRPEDILNLRTRRAPEPAPLPPWDTGWAAFGAALAPLGMDLNTQPPWRFTGFKGGGAYIEVCAAYDLSQIRSLPARLLFDSMRKGWPTLEQVTVSLLRAAGIPPVIVVITADVTASLGKLLRKAIRGPKADDKLRIEDVLALVAAHYGIAVADIVSKKRFKQVVLARQVASYLCYAVVGHGHARIIRQLGGQHHATLYHAVNKVKGMIAEDPDFARDMATLSELVRNA